MIEVTRVQVVLIVGHYAQHWQVLPVAAQHQGRLFVFVDHRTPIPARGQAIREHVPMREVETVDVFFADRSPFGCEEGAHLWDPIESHGLIVGGKCRRCNYAEVGEPVGASLFVERALAR